MKKPPEPKTLVSTEEHREIRTTREFAEMHDAWLSGNPAMFKEKVRTLSDKGRISAWVYCGSLGEIIAPHLKTLMDGGAGLLIVEAAARVEDANKVKRTK